MIYIFTVTKNGKVLVASSYEKPAKMLAFLKNYEPPAGAEVRMFEIHPITGESKPFNQLKAVES